MDITSAGPLLCGGITVFSPLLTFGIKPTDRVGIGGLGHMGLKFANAWSCEVTAFTSNASKTLRPNGRLPVVGAVLEPMPISVIDLMVGQKSVSSSPTGSPVALATMLDFAARHRISPQVEHFPMSKINDAFEHLRSGKARYRIVLDADFV